MNQSPTDPIPRLPRWLIAVASVAIAYHLVAVIAAALAAPSGPWPNEEVGRAMILPPQFAFTLHQKACVDYLRAIKMTHNYHFMTDQPGLAGVFVEARLKDAEGREIGTLKLPEADANPLVRHQQLLLMQGLMADEPVPPPQGEAIQAPGKTVPKVRIWEPGENRVLKIKTVAQHLVPRNQPVERPSDWSLLLARSYARYLGRTRGAASVELVRHTRVPIPPNAMTADNVQSSNFDDLVATFGELPR